MAARPTPSQRRINRCGRPEQSTAFLRARCLHDTRSTCSHSRHSFNDASRPRCLCRSPECLGQRPHRRMLHRLGLRHGAILLQLHLRRPSIMCSQQRLSLGLLLHGRRLCRWDRVHQRCVFRERHVLQLAKHLSLLRPRVCRQLGLCHWMDLFVFWSLHSIKRRVHSQQRLLERLLLLQQHLQRRYCLWLGLELWNRRVL